MIRLTLIFGGVLCTLCTHAPVSALPRWSSSPVARASSVPTLESWQDSTLVLARYRAAVEAYRLRGLDAAKNDLAQMNPASIQNAVTILHRGVLDRARSGDSDIATGWTGKLIGAAFVLHADSFVDGAKRGVVMPWQLECAALLLDAHRVVEGRTEFRRIANLPLAWLLQISGTFELLRAHLRTALTDYPNDAELLLARAVLEEAAVSPRVALSSENPRGSLLQAERTYQNVIKLDPRQAEARARLGYVLLRLSRHAEARRELAVALAAADEWRTGYLAALFLGATHEAGGDLQAAIASYRRAHDAAPACQTAAFALATALRLVGQDDTAADTARKASAKGPSACDDPWWSYDYGQAWKLEATLELLHQGVRE